MVTALVSLLRQEASPGIRVALRALRGLIYFQTAPSGTPRSQPRAQRSDHTPGTHNNGKKWRSPLGRPERCWEKRPTIFPAPPVVSRPLNRCQGKPRP